MDYRSSTQTLSDKKLLTFEVFPQESAFVRMNLTCRPQLPGRDWRKRVEGGLDWGLKVEEKLELILWAKNPAHSADGSSFGLLQKASPKLAMEYQLHCLEFQTKIDLGIFWHVDFQKGI